MISIALVLLLVIGINAIFRTTADTVGGGTAALSMSRELRNAYDALNTDFTGFLGPDNQPVLMIYNQNLPGFRDKADEKSDPWYTPGSATAIDDTLKVLDPNSNPPNFVQTYPPVHARVPLAVDNRNHRVDIISFVSNGRFHRQTGIQNDGAQSFQSNYTSDAAYVWYGHLRQPPNSTNDTTNKWLNPAVYVPMGLTPTSGNTPQTAAPTGPNTDSNANGFYTNQWILGRMAILMAKPQPTGNTPLPASITYNQVQQGYLVSPSWPPVQGEQPPQWAALTQPFGAGTPVTFDGQNPQLRDPPGGKYLLEDGACDLAGITVDDFRQLVKDAAFSPTLYGNTDRYRSWYIPLLSTKVGSNQPRGTRIQDTLRFACKPWKTRYLYNGTTLTQKQTRDDIASGAPAFVHGCGQFIVEFAGDYITQDVNNPDPDKRDAILAQASDGVLDFEIVPTANNGPKQKRIRWYGLPRNYSNNGSNFPDVRPVVEVVRDKTLWANQSLANQAKVLPFERIGYGNAPASPPDVDAFPQLQAGPKSVASYTCVWSPWDLQFPRTDDATSTHDLPVPGGPAGAMIKLADAYKHGFMPWMIRVTIRVDDPNGRLPDGYTVQYVFNLPHK
jgi:hypothetical protein